VVKVVGLADFFLLGEQVQFAAQKPGLDWRRSPVPNRAAKVPMCRRGADCLIVDL
jgi:hypothetical protein